MGKLTTHVLNLATSAPAARIGSSCNDLEISPPRLLAETLTDAQGAARSHYCARARCVVGRYALTSSGGILRAAGFQVTESAISSTKS